MNRTLQLVVVLAALNLSPLLRTADFPTLKPLIAVPDQVVLCEGNTAPKPLAKAVYQTRQGTRWIIEDGVLRGRPSSAEFQAKKKA